MNILTLRETGSSGAAALSDDETRILTGGKDPGGDEYAARLWDARSGKLLHSFPMHNAEITAVAISRDGRFIFAGDAQGCCSLWQADGTLRWENKAGHIRDVKAAAFLPDGRRVLLGQQRSHGRAMGRGHGKIGRCAEPSASRRRVVPFPFRGRPAGGNDVCRSRPAVVGRPACHTIDKPTGE